MDSRSDSFESKLQSATFASETEKTRYDKLLSQNEVQSLRELVSREIIDTDTIAGILNILVSTELKLTNFNDNDRYVLGKYLLWVTEYGKRFAKALRTRQQYVNIWGSMSPRHRELRKQIEIDYSETFKQSVHAYCFLGRSPLSLGGALIKKLTTDQSEIEYKGIPMPQPQPQTKLLGR